MRMLLTVEFPVEPFNTLVRTGTAGQKIRGIMDAIKPEAAYFTEQDGCRGGIFPQGFTNRKSIQFRHHHIEHNQIR